MSSTFLTGRQAIPDTGRSAQFIELRAVGKTYQASDGVPIKAVETVSASISKGEFVSILGPSGCGKSTLMMMIAGLLQPSQGEILFKKQPVLSPLRDFGVVFQDAVLLPWRNVIENVELPGEVAGLDRTARREAAMAVIRMVGLAGFETKRPNELSGGMQQRVAIARALLLKPELILMDEPFGALDAMTREQMNLELQTVGMESKATIVFVTHSISEAAFLSDRVLVMSRRPSTIQEAVEIDIPRPRPVELLSSDRLGSYISHLRRSLNAGEAAS
jgi:NitT/TauT family transport system ATP-binding protein